MTSLKHTVATAWRNQWKLRRVRSDPLWARLLILLGLGLLIGLVLTLLGGLFGGHLLNPGYWQRALGPTVFVALVIALLIGATYRLIERLAPQRFLDWTNGEPSALVGLFYAATSSLVGWLGWQLSAALIGLWRPVRMVAEGPETLLRYALVSVAISVAWGAIAHQRWRREQALRQAEQAQLRLLQGQIEPHFLFNTLAHVQALMDCDVAAAKQMLERFSDYLRASLSEMRGSEATVASEFRLLEQYLGLMQLRMEDRLSFRFELDPAAAAQALPPMLLQPLVENAIHHGIEPCCDAAELVIAARVQAGQLQLEVRDSGQGLEAARERPRASRGNGVALANIRERLAAQFGGRASFRLEDAAPAFTRGTRALLTLPLNA